MPSRPLAQRTATTFATALLAAVVATAVATDARGDDTIKHPGDHPRYAVEVEPHALLGLEHIYASTSFGAGARLSINVVHNGFVKSINNSVAVGFGADFLHYASCGGPGSCNESYLFFPVALQWNFYVGRRWSVFGEPGLFVYHGLSDTAGNGDFGRTGVRPALSVGGRFHISETFALTLRLGYPTLSFGISIL